MSPCAPSSCTNIRGSQLKKAVVSSLLNGTGDGGREELGREGPDSSCFLNEDTVKEMGFLYSAFHD